MSKLEKFILYLQPNFTLHSHNCVITSSTHIQKKKLQFIFSVIHEHKLFMVSVIVMLL